MKRGLVVAVAAIFAFVLFMNVDSQGGDKKEITIKQVMKAHGKGGLLEKVRKGDATPEEKKKLLELYEGLAKTMPPIGDEKSWKEKTESLVSALKADDTAALAKAADCKACHSVHKGKKKA